jgi:dual specificity phosphatase 3
VADFNFITSRIATGAALSSAADVESIVAAGIDTVVDCRDSFDDGPLFAGNTAINYLWNPTPDDGVFKPPEYWLRTLMFVLPLLALPDAKVLCHCAAGINRGPSTAYCVMVALSFPPLLAANMIRQARPVVGLRYASDALAACHKLGYI